jgi:hypothetical protein
VSRTSPKVETVGWESVGVRMRPNIESTTHGDSSAWKGLQGVDSKWGEFSIGPGTPGAIPLHIHGKGGPKALPPRRMRMP